MRFFLLVILAWNSFVMMAQEIPSDRVLAPIEIADFLKAEVRSQISEKGELSKSELAAYFRQKFSERFFYDYKTFFDRLTHYDSVFNNKESHKMRALDHLGKYNDSTQWVLPFNFLNGEPVNAYALRHLARQHKMVDIAFFYFHENKNPNYIRYFECQIRSLNVALEEGLYEKIEDGNGIYEAFRSGYRILNWLWIHNMFLNEKEYSDHDQLVTLATLLQHGQHLYERNTSYAPGNHQTRGMSALAMLSILLRDFKGTDRGMERAMLRLGEHVDREINDDGFQFERSVHYHMSDINNFFYVYQLAQINSIVVNEQWERKIRGLFTTLVKIAYPDRSAPVLQDDTEIPWAETNDISGAMTLGYLLFEDPEFGYFASGKVDDRIYWFLSNNQIDKLDKIVQKRPEYGSLAFPTTDYYIMREGWNPADKMMIISAGVDDEKPDHQHGDMLGVQAMANGHAILPNYQVRYSLEDLELFKNSLVKNVALVDDEVQGKKWTSNKGGSGFGKFLSLPNPEVIVWHVNDDFDLFSGRHDGFESIGVEYTRQVIYVKNAFWIVKDEFRSAKEHDYKQVWQGHYTHENGPNLLRATAADATGLDIMQLNGADSVSNYGSRGKEWSIVSKNSIEDFYFLTILYPYRGYNNRLDKEDKITINSEWKLNGSVWEVKGDNPIILSSENGSFIFGFKKLTMNNLILEAPTGADLFIRDVNDVLHIQSIGTCSLSFTLKMDKNYKKTTKMLAPGEIWMIDK